MEEIAMTFTRPEHSTYATIAGVVRQASICSDGSLQIIWKNESIPDDIRLNFNSEFNDWELRVRPDECDRAVTKRTQCEHYGRGCSVMRIANDGMVGLYFEGDEWGKFQSEIPDFNIDGPLEATKEVHVSELYDYHETHRDLQFDSWRERFGGAAQ